MRLIPHLLFCLLFLVSCKNHETKKELKKVEATINIAKTFNNPSEVNSKLPRLFSNSSELYFSWVSTTDSTSYLNYAILKDTTWTNTQEITNGNDWFVNWADFPVIAENNGNIITSHLQKSAAGTYTYDVKLNLYNTETEAWKNNFILHDDGTQSEHGFASILPFKENEFFITWLDGRNTIMPEGEEMNPDEGHNKGGAMSLRGAFVQNDGTVINDIQLDDRVCDCCQTSATKTTNHLLVAYRDRSEKEIRDISIVRFTENEGWSQPQTIAKDNWKIEGCPVNGPSIDAFENSVAVVWFTGANNKPMVNIVFSEDEGATFGLPIRLDNNDVLGRVDVVMLSESEAAVVWMEMVGEETLIQLVKVDSNGTRGEVITISKTSAERSSGFPQLERVGNVLYTAWTLVSGDDFEIKTAKIDIDAL